jgi:hypothetical protein
MGSKQQDACTNKWRTYQQQRIAERFGCCTSRLSNVPHASLCQAINQNMASIHNSITSYEFSIQEHNSTTATAAAHLQNGLRRTPPKENGDLNAKKEPLSPRSGRSSASSTPAPSGKKSTESSSEKPTTSPKPNTPPSAGGGATQHPPPGAPPSMKQVPGLPGPPFGMPGFHEHMSGGPAGPFGLENGFPRPPFDQHAALRPPLGIPPGGKP